MKTVKSLIQMQLLSKQLRLQGKRIGLVPTMGYFHEGHISLMTYARKKCDCLVVSIFVNPLQFGPTEDFKRYPRDIKRDRALAKKAGADILFCPNIDKIYPNGFQTHVEVEELSRPLCGQNRPGHFRGVTTVVAKLFNIIQPHEAVFGLKDYQQWLVIRRMAADLNIPVKITGRPTVRESDGLALSSRNTYLSPKERQAAQSIYQSLVKAQDLVSKGEKESEPIKKVVEQTISSHKGVKIEYISICHPETLSEQKLINDKTLLAIAVRIGRARLIDNCFLSPGESK